MSAKRDHIEIIHDMLKVMSEKGEKTKPTHILCKANLSHEMFTEYMNEILTKNLAEKREDNKGKVTYALTQKGFSYLKDYSAIKGFMDSYGMKE